MTEEIDEGPEPLPPRGYSKRMIRMNRKADGRSPGVQLGRYCIGKDISVTEVAEFFGVSRQTVYNWFSNIHPPREQYAGKIRDFLERVR